MESDSDDPDAFTGTLLRADPEYGVAPMDEDDDDGVGGVGSRDQAKLNVRFVTSLPEELRVVETPFEVPSDFARLGLSEIINHLLGLEPKVPFDFLVEGQFLRTSLKQWRKQQPAERSVVTIEYVKALVTPTEHKDSPHLDWVKSVAVNGGKLVVTGCFDSSLRLFDGAKNYKELSVATNALSGREIWDARWLSSTTVLCGGKSCSARVFEWSGKRLAATGTTIALQASVAQVCGAPDSATKCSVATASGGLHFYELNASGAEQQDEGGEQPNKRRKPHETVSVAALSLQAHREAVTAVQWRESGRLMTASLDHVAKIWDIDSNVAVSQFVCAKAVTAADWSAARSAVLTAHTDGAVGLWDTRSGAGEQRRFKSHTGWISSLAFRGDSNLFLSGSYDNTAKLWDVRSTIPLFTLGEGSGEGRSADKIFGVAWCGDDILYGGTSKKFTAFSTVDLTSRE